MAHNGGDPDPPTRFVDETRSHSRLINEKQWLVFKNVYKHVFLQSVHRRGKQKFVNVSHFSYPTSPASLGGEHIQQRPVCCVQRRSSLWSSSHLDAA